MFILGYFHRIQYVYIPHFTISILFLFLLKLCINRIYKVAFQHLHLIPFASSATGDVLPGFCLSQAISRTSWDRDWERIHMNEGRLEGKRETALANARAFKKLGVDVNIIVKATGLALEEVECR